MHRPLHELETEALKLSVEARSELTTRCLDSLELSETEIQERWVRQAERRAEEMRSGKVAGESVDEVLVRIRTKLG